MLTRGLSGTELAIGLAGFMLVWYVVGVQVNRRRARTMVRQIRDSLQSFGGTATIRWIGRSAFRIEAEQLAPPFVRLGMSALLEPRETILLLAVGRLRGRRDWLVIGATLSGPIRGSFEAYHPKRRGASDVIHDIQAKGWREEPLAGQSEMRCAAADADGRALAREIMAVIGGVAVWRIGLRHEAPQLTISLPIPASETRVPLPVFAALPRLAQTVLAGGAPRVDPN